MTTGVLGVNVWQDAGIVQLVVTHSAGRVNLPPAEARQVANALLEAADACEGRRS